MIFSDRSTCPSLITTLALGASERLIDNLMESESKLESADLEGHEQFLQKAGLPICDSPLEATAWENGFLPDLDVKDVYLQPMVTPSRRARPISRSDLRPPDWKMDSTVLLPTIDPITALDDDMQVQCLPVYQADQPKWTYWRVPKVSSYRSFARLPSWCRKPQAFTYHMCAENITKTTLVPALSKEDRKALSEEGVVPPESSAKDRFCVMCPVRRGSPRLLPCCLCHNWCHIGCSYQTHLDRVCPCHVQILDPRRKIIVLMRP